MTARLAMLLLCGAPLLGGACSEQLLNPMADHRQPRERAFRPSDWYADGLAMRAPPAGTVPHERRTMNPTLTTGIGSVTGQVAPNGERIVRYASKIPVPVTPGIAGCGSQALRHHLRHVPRPPRRRGQHRREADGVADPRRRCTSTRTGPRATSSRSRRTDSE